MCCNGIQAIIAIQAVVTGEELSLAMAFIVFTQTLGPAIVLTLCQLIFYSSLRAEIPREAPDADTEAVIAAGAIPPGWTVPQYDSISTYYVSNPSVLGALTTDPAWIALEIAAAGYVDGSRGTLLAGFETVK